ncbi:phBC6A51 family helix-turn-helix protein [Brevibacillus dissolubilis]|uniref:phBC6A51 family helix-turn-helix protein n=1 Tax=Brevibacillus dissolubilis TaxID=1844116 RepID=UPI001115DC1E|nr:phBC6A51 family helix-turn-helix protein [Brevibacillus dissolubilis]
MSQRTLRPEQMIAIRHLALPKEQRPTLKEIAKKCGVSERTINRWKQDEWFCEQWKKEVLKQTTEKLPDLLHKMPEIAIEQGNASMARTFLQAHGLLGPQIEEGASVIQLPRDAQAIKKRMEEYRRQRRKARQKGP